MEDLKPLLESQLREINALLSISKARLKDLENIPNDVIRATKCRTTDQYFRRTQGSSKSIYVPSKDIKEVQKIVQKSYDKRIYKELLHQQKQLKAFISNFDIEDIKKVYSNTCPGKRKLITPIIPSDEDYINKWLALHPGSQNDYPLKTSYESLKGELVRSKSEKIIADTMHTLNIPYQYEPRIELSKGKSVYPDFVALNIRTRKTYYWEHLGIVSDEDYASKNFAKIALYESNGIWIGENLIITQESNTIPLDIALVKRKIEKYLL